MYQCQKCNQTVPLKTKAKRVVIETRRVTYPQRKWVNEYKLNRRPFKTHDFGGEGYETVCEIMVCEACAEALA